MRGWEQSHLSEEMAQAETSNTREIFGRILGVETTENAEVAAVRTQLVGEADRFLTYFKDKGCIEQAEMTEVLDLWQNAIALDGEQLDRFLDYKTGPIRGPLSRLRLRDPRGKNEAIQRSIASGEAAINDVERMLKGSYAYVWEPITVLDKEALEAGLPIKLVVLNWARREELVERPGTVQLVADEESMHLICKLKKYGENVSAKWMSETMARIIKLPVRMQIEGWSQIKDVPEDILRRLRFYDYVVLFATVTEELRNKGVEEPGELLVDMFFGKADTNDESVRIVNEVLGERELRSLGEKVDKGYPLHREFESETGE